MTVILINADAVIIDMYRYLITVDLNVDTNTICICMLIYIVQTFTQYTDQTDREASGQSMSDSMTHSG